MSDRKSSRPRKSICYAKLGEESESDSDDDFACSSSSKKQKTVNKKEEKFKKEKKKNDSKQPPSMSKSLASVPSSILKRRSNFDDELQRALELSMVEASSSQKSDDVPVIDGTGCKSDNDDPSNITNTKYNTTNSNGRSKQECIIQNVRVDIEPVPSALPLAVVDEGNNISDNENMPNLSETTSITDQNQSEKLCTDDLSPNPPKLLPVVQATSSRCPPVIDDTIESVELSPEVCDRGRRKRTATKKMETPATTKRKATSNKKRLIDEDDDDKSSEVGSDFVPADGSSSEYDDDNEEDFSQSDNDSDFDTGKKRPLKKTVTSKMKNAKKISSAKSQKPSIVDNPKKTANKENTSSKSKAVGKNPTRKAPSLGGAPSLPSTLLSTPSQSISTPLARTLLPSPQSSSTSHKSTKPSPRTPATSRGLVGRQWKPPGQSSGSNASSPSTGSDSLLKSPSSSGLRLGLSRNQRVKPLHSSVKVL